MESEIEQPLVYSAGEIIDVRKAPPARIEQIRSAPALCPVCMHEGKIAIANSGPVFLHRANHQAEDPIRQHNRALLRRRMGELFPGSVLQENVELSCGYADIALARSNGTRLALNLQTQDFAPGEVRLWRETLRAERSGMFWLMDGRRLPDLARAGDESIAGMLDLGESACQLLRSGSSLVYLDPERPLLHWVALPRDLLLLIRKEGEPLGKSPCLLRRYPLSQLRIRQGKWWVASTFDGPAPPGLRMPAALQRRIDKALYA